MEQQPNTSAQQKDPREAVPVWCNTRPPANPEVDRRDLERSEARLATVLGR